MQPDLDIIRHSAAHVLAMAAMRLFPDAKIGIGPVTEDGYYYDFEFPHPISIEDMRNIESEMNLIIQENQPFSQIVVSKEEGFDILLKRGQIFKAELLREIPEPEVSFFRTGDEFIDLCRGPHVKSTGEIGVVKLTDLVNTHWRGDQTRPQMQRISGVAFPTLQELQDFLHKQEAVASRDFRTVGKHIQLTLGGQSEVVYTPGGTMAFKQIEHMITEQFEKHDFTEILASPIDDLSRVEESLDSFFTYKNRSYKELPIRTYTNLRNELESPIKIVDRDYSSITTLTFKSYFIPQERYPELDSHLESIVTILEKLKLKFSAHIFIPGLDNELLTQISESLQRKGIAQTQIVNPEINGANIEFVVKDSLNRNWTICHLNYRDRGMEFVSRVGEMSDAHSISSQWIVESLLAFFIEDQEGLLPVWLAPVQITIIPISDGQTDFSEEIQKLLDDNGFRTQVDARAETMQARIRHAELLKIPIIIVIGEKEKSNNSVSLRLRNEREVGLVSRDTLVNTILSL